MKICVKYELIIQYFSMLGTSLVRKSAFLEESESVDSDRQHFHLVGDFVIKEREIKRQRRQLLASLPV